MITPTLASSEKIINDRAISERTKGIFTKIDAGAYLEDAGKLLKKIGATAI